MLLSKPNVYFKLRFIVAQTEKEISNGMREYRNEYDKQKRKVMIAAQSITRCDESNPDNMRELIRVMDMSKAPCELTLEFCYPSSRGPLRRMLENFSLDSLTETQKYPTPKEVDNIT